MAVGGTIVSTCSAFTTADADAAADSATFGETSVVVVVVEVVRAGVDMVDLAVRRIRLICPVKVGPPKTLY